MAVVVVLAAVANGQLTCRHPPHGQVRSVELSAGSIRVFVHGHTHFHRRGRFSKLFLVEETDVVVVVVWEQCGWW